MIVKIHMTKQNIIILTSSLTHTKLRAQLVNELVNLG